MPFKSKSQAKFFFAKEDRGELPKGTAIKWAHKTKNIKSLPEKVAMTEPTYLGIEKLASSAELEKNAECKVKLTKKGKKYLKLGDKWPEREG